MENIQDFKDCCSAKSKTLVGVFITVLIVFFAVLTLSIALGAYNKIKESRDIGDQTRIIVVEGTGEIFVKPDLATVDFSVVSEGKTASEALSGNAEKMNAVINSAKSMGVKEDDLKTTNFYISPRYSYRNAVQQIYPYSPGNRILDGYDVTQTLQVKIRELDRAGQIIEGAVNAGANQTGDLQLTVDKTDQLKNQARAKAIEEAKIKAMDLSSQLGVKLDKIVSFSENVYSPWYPLYAEKANVGSASSDQGQAPEIQTGQNKISVSVSITYEID